jgi:hypothetical protein
VTSEEEAHFRVLKAIEANPDALLEKGAIKMENFRRSDTKLKKIAYMLTPSGISERLRLTQGYLERKRMEYETLKAEIDALERESVNLTKGKA